MSSTPTIEDVLDVVETSRPAGNFTPEWQGFAMALCRDYAGVGVRPIADHFDVSKSTAARMIAGGARPRGWRQVEEALSQAFPSTDDQEPESL